MATSGIDLCSNALLRLGVEPISSFTEGDVGNTCGTIYPDFIVNLLSIYDWQFASTKVQLARLSTAPLTEYTYQFQLPSDMIKLQKVYIDTGTGRTVVTDYRLQDGKLLTNNDTIYIDYTRNVAVSEFPPYFVEFAVLALASVLAIAVTDKAEYAQSFHQLAYGTANDNGNGGSFGKAKKLDSFQQPSKTVSYNRIITERFS